MYEQMKLLRMETKKRENRHKPPLMSPDVVGTADFIFSKIPNHNGDSGELLLARRKTDAKDRYLVKHAFTDCACNEFVYTKLALAMEYSMPNAVLFQLSPGEKQPYFQTEYIIGEQYLVLLDPTPDFHTIREQAENWKQYFAFYGLYSLTGESDGLELLLANNHQIYRVDTTDAFPISCFQLDIAGIDRNIDGPSHKLKQLLLSCDLSSVFDTLLCDSTLEYCLKKDADSRPLFLEPFARIREIPGDYIDDFLNTLCYFYPDFIGDYFKRYLSALQDQCAIYWRERREPAHKSFPATAP